MEDGTEKPLVLVIEDDISVRRFYAEALARAGFRVVEAHNGLQAEEKAADLMPDVIVTDLGLPGIDGFELCRRLHKNDRLRTIPVFAITGRYVAAADIARALREGCRSVMLKPVDADELAGQVRKVLEHACR